MPELSPSLKPVYCWRSECSTDDLTLLHLLPDGEMLAFQTKRQSNLPDTFNELTVKSLTLEQLRDLMRQVPDGHQMVRTAHTKHLTKHIL